MTIASTLIGEIRDVLQDTDASAYRWSDVTLMRFMSAACRQIVMLRSEANTIEVVHTVADSTPRRTVPADGISLVDVIANIDHLGVISSAIKRVEIDVLDAVDPDWRYIVTGTPDVDRYYSEFAFDEREPTAFWLYPRPATGKNCQISYAKLPAVLAATTDQLELSAGYDPPIVEYALWRALSMEGGKSQTRMNPEAHAKQHLDNFAMFLQLTEKEYGTIVRQDSLASIDGSSK
jgi:hypothetical protein